MVYEVFISHSTKDKKEADAACNALEEAGIKCWIAPRDILPGQDWREAIVNAIYNCQVIVLIHSINSNNSKDVSKEVALSINLEKTVVPCKIEEAAFPKVLHYSLQEGDWIDGINLPRKSRVKKLVEKVKPLVSSADNINDEGKSPAGQSESSTSYQFAASNNKTNRNYLPGKGRNFLYSLVGLAVVLIGWFTYNATSYNEETILIHEISTGFNHSMVLLEDSGLYVFGGNEHGQLGLGDKENRINPEILNGLTEIKSISAGHNFSLVLLNSGDVYSTGSNRMGQLAQDDTNERLEPEKIETTGGVKDISVGGFHSLFLMENGDVYSCGANYMGQLGSGSSSNLSTMSPQKIEGLSNAKAVSAGYDYSLVLLENGDLYSFGNGEAGRLGHGKSEKQFEPKKIEGLENVKAISAGYQHSLILTDKEDVYSFGLGRRGQLGHGDQTSRPTPTKIMDISNAKAIAAGRYHSIILTTDGLVYTFGSNAKGYLGLGNSDEHTRPTLIEEIPPIAAIAAGYEHSLLMCEENMIYSFGLGENGRLGLGDEENCYIPTVIDFFVDLNEAELQ